MIGRERSVATFAGGCARIGTSEGDAMLKPAHDLIPDRTDLSVRPSPRLLRRVLDGVEPIRYGTRIARFTVFQHGGHQRPVITRGSKHSRFRFTSRKTGLTQLGEGKGEEFLAYWNEVDGHVGDYQCHPGQFEISRPGNVFTYRPDALRQFVDGTVELIEVKRTPADLDADLRDKLADVREVCHRFGWHFRVLYDEDIFGIEPRVRRQNVEGIFSRRSFSLSRFQQNVARKVVGRGSPVAWNDLGEQLAPGDPLDAYAAIECLLARGLFVTDLDRRLGGNARLTPLRVRRDASAIRL
jgi:hypothetical protein